MSSRNNHNVDEVTIRKKIKEFEDYVPFYYAWFLNKKDSLMVYKKCYKCLVECIESIPGFSYDVLGPDGQGNLRGKNFPCVSWKNKNYSTSTNNNNHINICIIDLYSIFKVMVKWGYLLNFQVTLTWLFVANTEIVFLPDIWKTDIS